MAAAHDTFADIVLTREGDDATALVTPERTWTWSEVVAGARLRAGWLLDQPQPADRRLHVALALENRPEYVLWFCAAALAGSVVVGVNLSRTAGEVSDDLAGVDADLVIVDRRNRDLVAAGSPPVPVVELDDPAASDRLRAATPLQHHRARPDDIAVLLFSSGSTGRPKAAIVSHRRLAHLTSTMGERVRIRRDSVTYLCMPLFHGNSLFMNLCPAVAAGATVVLRPRFSARGFTMDVLHHGCTYTNYVGRALHYVLAADPAVPPGSSRLDLAYGTEASPADIERFSRLFGCEVMEGYGASEGVVRIARDPQSPPGALGVPPAGVDVRVLDPATGWECPRAVLDGDGRLLDPAAIGEMVAIGRAGAFEGYYRNPEATAQRIRGDDFWSGDLAYRDDAGQFHFAGRSSDWLRVDGENFSAAQVEAVIARVPGVEGVAVYAVPDPVTGDEVMAVVELAPGHDDPVAFARALGTRSDLGDKWWPRYVRVVDALPLTGSGKIDKSPLRRQAWAGGGRVWIRPGRERTLRILTDDDVRTLAARFGDHERSHLLPALP